MKEILDFIDDIKIQCPDFAYVSLDVCADKGFNGYVMRANAFHKDPDRTFCGRETFSKMKGALKIMEKLKKDIISEYNSQDFL